MSTDILDHLPDAVLTLDAHWRIRALNSAATGLVHPHGQALAPGVDCASLFGAPPSELPLLATCSLQRKDGTVYLAEVNHRHWTEAGSPRTTLVMRDLTERHQVERRKDDFIATVSHELRTPLTSIVGAIGLLASGAAGALPSIALPLVDIAHRNGARLSRLIDDLLDLSKLEADRIRLDPRTHEVQPLIAEAIASQQLTALAKNVTLVMKPTPSNPFPTDGDAPLQTVCIALDADRFQQVMSNLLDNAIHHSPPGQTVTVATWVDHHQIEIRVCDQGPGIPPHCQKHLFEKFAQADQSDHPHPRGNGLGLHVSRLLVERMGGTIRLEGAIQEAGGTRQPDLPGSTFIVAFPLNPLR